MPLPVELQNELPDLNDPLGVQAVDGLVQHQKVRIPRQGHGDERLPADPGPGQGGLRGPLHAGAGREPGELQDDACVCRQPADEGDAHQGAGEHIGGVEGQGRGEAGEEVGQIDGYPAMAKERDESLESFFINLVGGGSDD